MFAIMSPLCSLVVFLGAGWGGCTVSLVPEAIVDSFIAKVKETYGPYKDLEGDRLGEVIFATTPSSGACGTCFSCVRSHG